MQATHKLYWDDPFTARFEATAIAAASFEGRPSIVLPETIFYPEGGGQLGDTGSLSIDGERLAVIDAQIDEAGVIHHILEQPRAITPGEHAVVGEIDVSRRRDHMAQHTAQHMLSRALLDEARAPTVSARLGATSCTLDVDVSQIPDAALHRAEDLVNDVVRGDVGVRALFPTAEELARMELRRAPKVSPAARAIRVIEVEGFDLTPCGGTHCTRSGQIGLVRVQQIERYKGKLRVTFAAARRALDDAREKAHALTSLAQKLTCGPLDVGGAVAKLQTDIKQRNEALSQARGELLDLLSRELLAQNPPDPSGTTLLRVERAHDDVGMLRSLAGKLAAARPDVVALCTTPDPESGGLLVVAQRGEKAAFDCGAWMKDLAQKTGGRGGGKADRAEGRLPKGTEIGRA